MMHENRKKLSPAAVFWLSSILSIVILSIVISIALTVQKNRIEDSSVNFYIASDCEEGEGAHFIYNGTRYIRLLNNEERFFDWIPKETDTTKGIKTETLTAYALEDDINSYIFEVQVFLFDNYYCYSEAMSFPAEDELPDSIIAYCGAERIRIEDITVISLLINNPKKTEELLKAFFSDTFDNNELELYADWDDFPLMKCLMHKTRDS